MTPLLDLIGFMIFHDLSVQVRSDQVYIFVGQARQRVCKYNIYVSIYIYIKDIIELYIYIYNNHCKSERKAIGQQGNILHSEMSALFRYMVYRL